MKKIAILFIIFLSLYSCKNTEKEEDPIKVNWNKRAVNYPIKDSLEIGKSYLSIYSQIYSYSQHKRYNLTAMVSLRNASQNDTIYLLKANYYGTHGELLKTYFNKPVYLAPLETLEIVINESDISGGTGSNFIFDWKIPNSCPEPIFEGVMTSTAGQQGLSFTTHSKRIN